MTLDYLSLKTSLELLPIKDFAPLNSGNTLFHATSTLDSFSWNLPFLERSPLFNTKTTKKDNKVVAKAVNLNDAAPHTA